MAESLPQLDEIEGVIPANQARSREAQARLLKAGERVFAAKGYDAAHVSDIAAAAQCSIGSFYRRFRDKEALFRALHVEFGRRIERNMERFLALPATATAPSYEVIRSLVENTTRVIERHPGFFRALFQRSLAGQGAAQTYVPALRAADEASGRRFAAFLRGRPDVPEDPQLEAKCVFGVRAIEAILVNRCLRSEVTKEPVGSPFVIESLTEMFAGYLAIRR